MQTFSILQECTPDFIFRLIQKHVARGVGAAHREADGREYHPVSRLAGMRVCRHVGEQAYSKIFYRVDNEREEILRLPCQAALQDGRACGISMSLEFLVLFFQEKSTEDNYNPVNQIPFGHPLYTPPGALMDRSSCIGLLRNSKGEWWDDFRDLIDKPYVRKEGSKKLMWISKKAAAESGIVGKAFSRITLGIYAGKFEDVNVFETNMLGTLEESQKEKSGGVTLPGIGIIVGKGVLSKKYDIDLLKHEYGHILQFKSFGYRKYYEFIAVNSFLSAARDGIDGWDHNSYWIETYANMLSSIYFNSEKWNNKRFPIECPSYENWLQLKNY